MKNIERTEERFERVEVNRRALDSFSVRVGEIGGRVIDYPSRWTLPRFRDALQAWLAENGAALSVAVGTTITMRVALTIVGLLASAFIRPNNINLVTHPSKNLLVDMWARWDAIRYLQIAAWGYQPHTDNLAFFPLLPGLIRGLAPLFDNQTVITGLVITTIAFVAALYYLYKLLRMDFDRGTTERTILYLSIAPMAFFFMSIYTEPLFLLFSVASIYYARRAHWSTASAMGALAVLTRPPGILLLVPLGYEALRQLRRKEPGAFYGLFSLSLLPGVLVGWMYYLWRLTGDMLAFVHAQAGNTWHRTSDTPWHTLQLAVQRLQAVPPMSFDHAQYTVDLAAAVIMIIAAVLAFRYLPHIYSLYMATSVVLLLTSRSDHQILFSMPRFAMVLFPLFILLAMAGKRPQLHRFIVITSTVLLGLYTALFVQWYWIA